jgi:hypothetical protein
MPATVTKSVVSFVFRWELRAPGFGHNSKELRVLA